MPLGLLPKLLCNLLLQPACLPFDVFRSFCILAVMPLCLCFDAFRHFGRRWADILALSCKPWLRSMRPPPKILKDMKYYPRFKDCSGTIDGTIFQIVVPSDKSVPYRSGKKIMHIEYHGYLFIRNAFQVDIAWLGRFCPWPMNFHRGNDETER